MVIIKCYQHLKLHLPITSQASFGFVYPNQRGNRSSSRISQETFKTVPAVHTEQRTTMIQADTWYCSWRIIQWNRRRKTRSISETMYELELSNCLFEMMVVWILINWSKYSWSTWCYTSAIHQTYYTCTQACTTWRRRSLTMFHLTCVFSDHTFVSSAQDNFYFLKIKRYHRLKHIGKKAFFFFALVVFLAVCFHEGKPEICSFPNSS